MADQDARAWPLILDLGAWYGAPVVVALTGGAHAREVAALPEAARVAQVVDGAWLSGGLDRADPRR